MIASIPEEFQLSTGFSNHVKKVMNGAFGSSTPDQSRERELFYLRGLNQFNGNLQFNNEKTIKIMEFLGQIIKGVIKFPKFEIGVLKKHHLVFENKEFILVENKNGKISFINFQFFIFNFLLFKQRPSPTTFVKSTNTWG